MEKLANLIKSARLVKGLSLRNFSDIVEISPTYLSLMENGHVSPSNQVLRRLCKELGLNYDECLKETKQYKKVFS